MAGQIISRGENTWLVRIFLGRDAAGKRRYHNRTVRGTKKDAERYRNRVLRERDLGTFVEPSRQAAADFFRQWLADSKPGISAKSRDSYRFLLETYVIPKLGTLRLDRIGPADIQNLYASMADGSARKRKGGTAAKNGLSPRTIRYTHSVLRSALQQAVKWGKLARNPADLVELPSARKKEMRALSSEQATAFLEAAEADRYHALWVLLIASGLRPGEALGLKWSDLEDNRLHVQRSLSRRDGAGWELKEPKTSRSRRVVPLPATAVRVLAQHKARQAEEKLKAGPAYADHGLIFATRTGGPLDYRVVVRRHFKELLKEAGLGDLRPYDLRHTCATLLLKAREHPKVVSERLGHSSIVMTLETYSHVLPDMQQRAADQLESLLFGRQEEAAS